MIQLVERFYDPDQGAVCCTSNANMQHLMQPRRGTDLFLYSRTACRQSSTLNSGNIIPWRCRSSWMARTSGSSTSAGCDSR